MKRLIYRIAKPGNDGQEVAGWVEDWQGLMLGYDKRRAGLWYCTEVSTGYLIPTPGLQQTREACVEAAHAAITKRGVAAVRTLRDQALARQCART